MRGRRELRNQGVGTDTGCQAGEVDDVRHPDPTTWSLQALVTQPTWADAGVGRFLERERE
jgi:hypothetical protein